MANKANKPNPALVGGFILGGCLLVIAAITIWGSGRLFEHRIRYVCYFPGSVHGLNIGAPVKYRGVPIGEVVGMRVRYQQADDDHHIPVFIELTGRAVRELGTETKGDKEANKTSGRKLIADLVIAGLRARLDSESFVTGQLYVNLDLFPETPVVLVHQGGDDDEIPTVPTQLEEIEKTMVTIMDELKKVDLQAIAKSLGEAVEGISKLVNTPSVARSLDELPATIASARKLLIDLDGGVGKLAPELTTMLDPRGSVWGELSRTFVDVQHAAQAVRSFADFLQRNPNALLVGKKKP